MVADMPTPRTPFEQPGVSWPCRLWAALLTAAFALLASPAPSCKPASSDLACGEPGASATGGLLRSLTLPAHQYARRTETSAQEAGVPSDLTDAGRLRAGLLEQMGVMPWHAAGYLGR